MTALLLLLLLLLVGDGERAPSSAKHGAEIAANDPMSARRVVCCWAVVGGRCREVSDMPTTTKKAISVST